MALFFFFLRQGLAVDAQAGFELTVYPSKPQSPECWGYVPRLFVLFCFGGTGVLTQVLNVTKQERLLAMPVVSWVFCCFFVFCGPGTC
jgi:hypothetical protein